MKKLIITALVFALLASPMMLVGCTSFSGSSSNLNHAYSDGVWTVTATSVNGTLSRSFNLQQEQLDSLRVTSVAAQGSVQLVLIQGDVEKTVILDQLHVSAQPIDTSDFNPGSVRVRLNFTNARGVSIVVSWR